MKRIALLLCLSASAWAATTPRGLVVDDLTLKPQASAWRQGALVLRAEVRNPTGTEQTLRLRYGDGSSWGDGLASATADLEIPAGGTSRCSIPLPRIPHPGRDRLVAIDASGKETEVAASLPSFRSWQNDDDFLLYASRSLSGETIARQLREGANALKLSSSRYGVSSAFNAQVSRAGDFADPWPGDARAYSVFAAVLLAERDLPELSSETVAALRDYAALGGTVLFVGAPEIPEAFRGAPLAGLAEPSVIVHQPSTTKNLDEKAPFAEIALAIAIGEPTPSGKTEPLPPEVPAAAAQRCGLGLLAAVPATLGAPGSTENLPDPLAAFVLRHAFQTRELLSDQEELAHGLSGSHPHLELSKPPVGIFLFLLGAFAVLAGPVALRVLARRNRRIHILWVLPALSAVFSLAILVALLLRDGIRPTLERRSAVLLDQRAGRAVLFSEISLYAPLTLRALDLPADAIVTPSHDSASDLGGGSVRSGATARYEGWLAPRTPGRFALSAVRATPLRLEVRRAEDGSLEVMNAFGVPIRELRLYDEAGRLLTASGIAPGATTAPVAAESEGSAMKPLESALQRGAMPWTLPADELSAAAPARRRLYAAVLDGAPFDTDPIPGRPAHRSASTIVYGTFQP